MRAVEARARLYGLLGESFTYPDDEFAAAVRDGSLLALVRTLCAAVAARLCDGLALDALHEPEASKEALAVEYTRLFDAGMHGTSCSLNGGLQVGPQMKVMEEAVRFYNHFGLTLPEDRKELPDHLTTELEFLHFLSCGEQDLSAAGKPTRAYEMAQRDFIARHPGRWVPLMRQKLAELSALPFYLALSALLEHVLAFELARLQELHGRASLEVSGELPFDGN